MLHLFKQAISGVRNLVGLGVVSSLDDTGQAMTVNVATGQDVNRADVEVATPWGFNSSPPPDGMLAVVIAIGGDPSNMIALHPHNPSCRFGALLAGEAVIYGADGSRVHVRNGAIEIWSTNVKIFGNVAVEGNITATGDIVAGLGTQNISQLDHDHQLANVQTGGATLTTTPPIAGT